MLSHIKLKNWKNFKGLDVSLQERAFLVGPNASGKSNFLDAFRFIKDLAKPGGGLQDALESRGGLSHLRCYSARNDPGVSIEVEINDGASKWRYSLELRQEQRGHHGTYIYKEEVWKDNDQIVARPNKEDKSDKERLTQTYLEQVNANGQFRSICQILAKREYLHLVPQLLRFKESFTGPGIPGDPYGRGLVERIVRTPEKTRKSRLKKIENALSFAVPQFRELRDCRDKVNGTPHLEVKYEHWRPQGAWQREDQFSDGTLRLIGLLWSLLDGDGLLLLEEPELSLHSGLVNLLPGMLSRLSRPRRRQIVLSSHSADLLGDKGIDAQEVIILCPSSEGKVVKLASDIREVKDLLQAGMSIADAVLPLTQPSQAYQLSLFP